MVNRNSSGFAISYYLSALYLFETSTCFFVCLFVLKILRLVPSKCKVVSLNLGPLFLPGA